MGGGTLLALTKLNPHLKISGIICSNPFIDFHKNHKVHRVFKYIVELLPKKILGLTYNPPVDPFKLANNPQLI